jgi:predicted nucleic acid-binding protein
MDKVFIDSDVIIDYLYDRYPFSENASKIFNLCALKKILGFTSPLIIANVYYVLRKTADHESVKSKIKGLLDHIGILSMNQKIVLEALYSDFSNFEDALQIFTVLKVEDINIIITRNVKDYRKSSLSVYTPESFLKTLNK